MLKVVAAGSGTRANSFLRLSIEWEALGLQLAGTAANAAEALQLVESCQPDILLTDMHLPGCSGLALMEQARKAVPQLETAVISEDGCFEHVQSALRLGAGDFLLEPVTQQQLTATLNRLAQRCRQREKADKEMEKLQEQCREDALCLQNWLMRDLLSGTMKQADAQTLWQTYRFQQENRRLQLALVQVDYDDARVAPAALRMAQEQAAQTLSQRLAGVCPALVICISEGFGGVLMGFDEGKEDAVRKQLKKCLNMLCTQDSRLAFTLALTPVLTDAQQLCAACAQAKETLKERLILGTGRLLDRPGQRCGWKLEQVMKPYRRALMKLMEGQSAQVLRENIDLLEQEARSQNACGGEIDEMVKAAVLLFLQQPQVTDARGKNAAFKARMAHIGSAERLFDVLRSTIDQEAEQLAARQHGAGARPIRQAKDYVISHYREPITLEKVCGEVGLSVSYFSTLFKRETGENFLRFLTRTRMERAKELLAQTSMPLSEICTQVGYSDLKHFLQTFKKETNLSPGRFRKLYG